MIRSFLLISLLARAAAANPAVTIDPPPGWVDISARQNNPAVLLALKGPETSSFVLARIKPIDFDNRGAVRGYLQDILAALNRKTRMNFTVASNIAVVDYDNGLNAQYIRANLNGKPRLILAAARLQGLSLVATLNSAVADTMLPSILGALKVTGAAAGVSASRQFESEDGQLLMALPEGASSRELTPQERKQGFVAAIVQDKAELMILKVVDVPPLDKQAAAMEEAVRKAAGVEPGSVQPAALARTQAGPAALYSYGTISAESQFAAGFLPWCYWSYSIFAKGPEAQQLLTDVLSGITAGSSSEPGLVAATPRLELPSSWPISPRAAAALGATVFVLFLLVLARRRRDVVGYGRG